MTGATGSLATRFYESTYISPELDYPPPAEGSMILGRIVGEMPWTGKIRACDALPELELFAYADPASQLTSRPQQSNPGTLQLEICIL